MVKRKNTFLVRSGTKQGCLFLLFLVCSGGSSQGSQENRRKKIQFVTEVKLSVFVDNMVLQKTLKNSQKFLEK